MAETTLNEKQLQVLELQIEHAPIHEAGHVIAARHVGLEIVSVDLGVEISGKCGNTKVVPMGANYSISTGLPWDAKEALDGFHRHNFEIFGGAAAQVNYRYLERLLDSNGFATFQPEIWGVLLEFPNKEDFYEFDPTELTHGMAFFFNKTGASGDWQTLLKHFQMLPYDHFQDFQTHGQRIAYIRAMWAEALNLIQEQWDKVIIVANALRDKKSLTGLEVEELLKEE